MAVSIERDLLSTDCCIFPLYIVVFVLSLVLNTVIHVVEFSDFSFWLSRGMLKTLASLEMCLYNLSFLAPSGLSLETH